MPELPLLQHPFRPAAAQAGRVLWRAVDTLRAGRGGGHRPAC
ncbi:hypothetical protein TOK_1069 [Pseudonocardia sp. N23]|nr:hypothetical protein TOK_1069 [Pseudonocardia sp. N23]